MPRPYHAEGRAGGRCHRRQDQKRKRNLMKILDADGL